MGRNVAIKNIRKGEKVGFSELPHFIGSSESGRATLLKFVNEVEIILKKAKLVKLHEKITNIKNIDLKSSVLNLTCDAPSFEIELLNSRRSMKFLTFTKEKTDPIVYNAFVKYIINIGILAKTPTTYKLE